MFVEVNGHTIRSLGDQIGQEEPRCGVGVLIPREVEFRFHSHDGSILCPPLRQ